MSFKSQIVKFNTMYGLSVLGVPAIAANEFPTNSALIDRLANFKRIMIEEIEEVDALISNVSSGADDIAVLTELADWLGDLQVYCASEMAKFGLDNEVVLDIIMQSNMSKLGADGKPIYDARGKVMKGPAYWRPEPMIKHYIARTRNENQGEQP